jgi:hypothetical protein
MSSLYPRQSNECPICFAPMKEYTDVIDVYNGMGPVCEHYQDCPNKCYSYEYAYGGTRVSVTIRSQHIEFGWHYSDTDQTVRAETDAIDLVCEAARRAQLEDYWNLVHGHAEQHHPVLG